MTAVIKRSGRYTRTVVHAIGDELQPLPATVLERVARDLADKHGSVEPGLHAYAAKLRAEQRGKMYVPDRKDIPRDRSFDYYVPCSLAHPELCAQKEPHLVTACIQITKTAYQALKTFSPGILFSANSSRLHHRLLRKEPIQWRCTSGVSGCLSDMCEELGLS